MRKLGKKNSFTAEVGLVEYALSELLMHENQKQILKLKGKIQWERASG